MFLSMLICCNSEGRLLLLFYCLLLSIALLIILSRSDYDVQNYNIHKNRIVHASDGEPFRECVP